MASFRAVKLCHTFKNRTLDAHSSLMAMRQDGSNIGLAMLLHCSQSFCVTILRYLAFLMIVGYEETDWPSAYPQSAIMHLVWAHGRKRIIRI